ncbi:uncharacterized protein LOC143519265 [Brachyhypopomus gauderio]|uniref:uncharacterized protein LOC143519265 n=1 Tax=Brachyhypopomus gauderio TaxID=698409 RepID=UPI00404239DD
MRYTFSTDDCMVITIPLGSLTTTGHGDLMPEKFTCVFRDVYKVFLRGRPKALGVAQLTAGLFILCLGSILISSNKNSDDGIVTLPSVVFIACGVLTYAAGYSPLMIVMKISFVFNIIGIFWAVTTFVLSARNFQMAPTTLDVGLRSLIIALHVFELVLAAVLIFWESKAICRAHFNTLPMITLKQEM